MMGDGTGGVTAETLQNPGNLLRLMDAETALPFGILRRQQIEADREGLLEQTGEQLGEWRGSGDDADLRGAESIAVEKDAIAFGDGKSAPVQPAAAELCFCV